MACLGNVFCTELVYSIRFLRKLASSPLSIRKFFMRITWVENDEKTEMLKILKAIRCSLLRWTNTTEPFANQTSAQSVCLNQYIFSLHGFEMNHSLKIYFLRTRKFFAVNGRERTWGRRVVVTLFLKSRSKYDSGLRPSRPDHSAFASQQDSNVFQKSSLTYCNNI